MQKYLQNVVYKLKNVTFFRHGAILQVSYVAGGAVAAQALNVLILPIVSRIYSPADYGVMAVYLSIVAILSELSGFRYYLAIPLPKSKKYAEALIFLSLIIQVCFVSAISLILLFFGKEILLRFSFSSFTPYMFIIPIGLLFIGVYRILMQWSIREGSFRSIGITKISQCIAGGSAKILLGLLGIRPAGLLIGAIISEAGGITTLYSASIKKNGFPIFNKNNIYRVMIRYRKMPLFSTWYGLINSIGSGLPQLFLTSQYGVHYAGLCTMASSLLSIPINFVGQAMGQVFIQRASIAKNSNNISSISMKAYLLLLKIGFFPIALISIFAPPLFSFFLGERWGASGIYAIVLVPFIAYRFAFSPLSMLYLILDKQESSVVHEVTYLVSRIFGLALGYFWKSPVLSILFYSVFCFFVQFYRVIYLLSVAGNSKSLVIKETIKIITEALLMLVLPILCLFYKVNLLILMIVVMIVSSFYLLRTYKYLSKERII